MCYEFCLKCQKAITDPELHDWQITPIEQNDEQHSKTCRRCEKQIEEEHRFEFIEDTATCKQEGETVSRCMDCGYEKREPSEKLSHRPAIHVSEQEHWEECEVCGEEIEGSRAEHRYEWDDGLQDWACTCGYTHKEVCKGTLEAILDLCTAVMRRHGAAAAARRLSATRPARLTTRTAMRSSWMNAPAALR